MISETELLVMGFIALGGVVMLLPAVLMNKFSVTVILKGIGAFGVIIGCSALFYLIVTDATIIEILSLKANSLILPKRIFSVSYTMIVVLIVVLPFAMIRAKIDNKDEKA